MSLNPFSTLTGRLVLVTVIAVIVSYAAAFVLYTNERGAALRRAAEASIAERFVYTAERLRAAPPDLRARIAEQSRDPGIRYSVGAQPDVGRHAASGAAARLARAIAERAPGLDTRVESRIVEEPLRRWRGRRGSGQGLERPPPDRGQPQPLVRVTRATISAQIEEGVWLNARARLRGPRPAPLSLLAAGIVSILAVGLGAALVARQIGRPLADLADAARALGAGQTDVEAPVRGPDDVRRASSAFNAMAQRLGRQLGRQREMLWALSHDLRTPITALKLRAELIENEAVRQRLLAPIEEMEVLTEQALALARAGTSEEKRVRVDLAELAITLASELRDIGMPVEVKAPKPVFAVCRPSEVARALRNLAENAARHGGGGEIRVFRNEQGEAVLEVVDDGPGVSPEVLDRLATPFFRADPARSKFNGAGLGLAIAQAIADGHGGRVEFANRVGGGFSATFLLPGDQT